MKIFFSRKEKNWGELTASRPVLQDILKEALKTECNTTWKLKSPQRNEQQRS